MRYLKYILSWIGIWLGLWSEYEICRKCGQWNQNRIKHYFTRHFNFLLVKLVFLAILLNVLSILLKGCSVDSFNPPTNTTEYIPSAIYKEWWADVERCSGLKGDFAKVHWFATPDVSILYGDIGATGVWSWPNSIYVAAQIADTTWQIVTNPINGTPTDYRRFVVQHEMLHDLTQSGGHGNLFDRCSLRTF